MTMVATSPVRPLILERFGPALFMGMFLFFWVSTSPYIDLVAVESLGPGSTVGGSNLINQLTIITLTGLLVAYAIVHPSRNLIGQPRLLMVLMFGWFIFVSIVSDHPADAVKRVVLALMTYLCAAIFLFLPRSEEQFAKLLAIGTLIMLAFAYFGVAFLPRYAIHQPDELTEPMNAGLWRGQFTHKNAAAAVMLVAVFFGLYVASTGRKAIGWLIVVLSTLFLVKTGGKSSTAMLPAVLLLEAVFTRFRWLRLPLSVGGITAFNFVALGSAFSPQFADLVKSLGVDPSFTNRTDIWKIAIDAIFESPILGYGFQGFWQTPEMLNSSGFTESWAYRAFNGHNAYLDILLTTGLPGLLLTLCFIFIVPLRAIARQEDQGNTPALTRLFRRVWLYAIYAACLETTFYTNGSAVSFMFVVSIYGLRLQSRDRLVHDPRGVS